MAELTPKFMDLDDVYSGDELGLPYRDILGEGIVGADDLLVSATSPASLSVDVAAGAAWVTGDTDPDFQPTYRVFNDAVVNKGITPDASQPRKVLVVAQVTDEAFAGTGREWEIVALHGTPAGSPAEPALPDSALPLAMIDVAAAATEIEAADITDRRQQATVGGGQVLVATESAAVILRKTTAKDVVSTTAAVDLLNGEITIPAGAMSTDKLVRATLVGDYLNNTGSSQSSTVTIALGAGVLFADALQAMPTNANRRAFKIEFVIANLGAANAQRLGGNVFMSDPTNAANGQGDINIASPNYTFGGTGAVDTAAAQALVVTITHPASSANLSWRLQYALIEVV